MISRNPAPPKATMANTPLNKPLEQWSFQELVTFTTWSLMQGLVQGHKLESLMHAQLELALRWRAKREPE